MQGCISDLTVLNLSNNRITGDGVAALAKVLHATSVTHLLLSGNTINDQGAVALARSLPGNATLQTLDLAQNDLITQQGIAAFAMATQVNRSLSLLALPDVSKSAQQPAVSKPSRGVIPLPQKNNELALGADALSVMRLVGAYGMRA